jgi:hypothetical protein
MDSAAAGLAMILPTRVDPVKLIRRMDGWATRTSTIRAASAGAFDSTLTTPLGKPASLRIRPIR